MAKAPPLYQYNINSENDKEKQLHFVLDNNNKLRQKKVGIV